jgi:hypothetical protein
MRQQGGRRGIRSRRGERGASPAKIIVSILILALVAHSAYVFLPVYIAVYDFNTQVETQANFGAPKSNDAIVKALLAYASERKLPLKRENIKVNRTQSRLVIEADYTVPIKFIFYTHNWHVTTEHSAVLF